LIDKTGEVRRGGKGGGNRNKRWSYSSRDYKRRGGEGNILNRGRGLLLVSGWDGKTDCPRQGGTLIKKWGYGFVKG